MKPNGGGKIPGEVEKALKDSFGSIDKAKEDFIQAGVTQFGSGWAWLTLKDGKIRRPRPERRKPARARRQADPRRRRLGALLLHRLSNRRPDYLKALVDTSSIGNMSPSCSARSKLRPTPSGREPEGARRSVGQVERLLRADIDVGRIHRLTVGEGPVQVHAAIEAAAAVWPAPVCRLSARRALSSSLPSRSRPPAAGRDRPCASSSPSPLPWRVRRRLRLGLRGRGCGRRRPAFCASACAARRPQSATASARAKLRLVMNLLLDSRASG